MNVQVKSLVGACLLSLAVLAAMMVPGLLMLPSLATAGTPFQLCSSVAGSGTTVCYTCASGGGSPRGVGCDQGTPQAPFREGYCVTGGSSDLCTQKTFVCGNAWNCNANPPQQNGTCSNTTTCANF